MQNIYRVPLGPLERLVSRLVYWQRIRWFGPHVISTLLGWRGTELLARTIGPGLRLVHCGTNVVVTPRCTIAANVTIMNGVSIGRSDIWNPMPDDFHIVIENEAILGTGAKVLNSHGTLTVAEGSVVGANAVLTQSTGPWEIWAGSPARPVGKREPVIV